MVCENKYVNHNLPRNVQNEIIFFGEPGKWFMKISKKGFEFNREEYPNSAVDDFARAFMELIEKEFIVTFERRKKDENDHVDNHNDTHNDND